MSYSKRMSNNVSVSVEFEKLSYHVPIKSSDFKSILKCLNGNFLAGKFNVIMGQSGSGKSSLLNILAGYITENVLGNVYLNGKSGDMKWFNKISTYIMQDDMLQPYLTFREAMMFSAHLKLGNCYKTDEKEAIVEDICQSLRMTTCMDLMPNQMSGGQKKRFSVALELVSDPSVIFLDEPTSGLDNVSAKQCIELLKSLTNKGKTVICSMHQPSDADILLFDNIYLLHDGNCIYTGGVNKLVPYLAELDYNCPITSNPIDYAIEIASTNFNTMETLVENSKKLTKVDRNSHLRKRLTLSEIFARNASEKNLDTFSTNFLQQITILTRRLLLQTVRNRFNLVMQIACYFLVGLSIGSIYTGMGKNGSSLDKTFMMCANLVFVILVCISIEMALVYPVELKILKREIFNAWYRITPYYISHFLISIPFSILLPIIISIPSYVLSDQPLEFERYIFFVIPLIVLRMGSQALGMIIGSVFNVKNGAILSPSICSIFVLFSVYGMGYGPYIGKVANFIMDWNFARSAVEAMMLATMSERNDIICEEVYCHYKKPEVLLRDMGVIDANYTVEVVKIAGFTMILKLIGYLLLEFRLRNKYWEKIKIIQNKCC